MISERFVRAGLKSTNFSEYSDGYGDESAVSKKTHI